MTSPLGSYARYLHSAGFMPLPVRTDGSKAPAVQWKEYQDTAASFETIDDWFARIDTDGIGVLTGAISGELEMLEFEGRAVMAGMVQRYAELLAEHGLDEIWQRICDGWTEVTPSGGFHMHYKIAKDSGIARRNTKLARNADGEVLIETRGEGGFTVIAPSGGRTHPSGTSWAIAQGAPSTVATISGEERDMLYAVAAMLDQTPERTHDGDGTQINYSGGTGQQVRLGIEGLLPGDDFNARAKWDDILLPRGWHKEERHGFTAWVRPGKTTPGISATTGVNGADNLFVFSSATEFRSEVPYSKFAAITELDYNGDFAAAAKDLRRKGYGQSALAPAQQPAPPLQPITPLPPRHLTSVPPLALGQNPSAIPEKPIDPASYGPTEVGLADMLWDNHGEEIRYVVERGKWLRWDGTIWRWDLGETVSGLVATLARQLPEIDPTQRTFKRRALSERGMLGVLGVARRQSRFLVPQSHLDAYPEKINTPAGAVNLRTGQLEAPNPSELHTRSTACVPNFDGSEAWEKFLSETFGGDTELIRYVQVLMGCSIIGEVTENILPFCIGPGGNGKGVLLGACLRVLGDYGMSGPEGFLTAQRGSVHPTEIAQLDGARLVVCSEVNEHDKFDEAKVKRLTGGDDLRARYMHRDHFNFTPSHQLWLMGNNEPAVENGGPSFWRRLRLIPFLHTPAVVDTTLQRRLGEEEGPAVLAWIIAGAKEYLRNGLPETPAVGEATARYQADQDSVGQFVAEECLIGGGEHVTIAVTKLRERYERFCREAGLRPHSAKRLTQELRGRFGIGASRTTTARLYTNVSLTSIPEDRIIPGDLA